MRKNHSNLRIVLALWFDARGCRLGLSQLSPRGDDMENLIDIFCHAIGITDPLSIKIAVGVTGERPLGRGST